MAERFFAILECELIAQRSWKTEACLAVFTGIDSGTTRAGDILD